MLMKLPRVFLKLSVTFSNSDRQMHHFSYIYSQFIYPASARLGGHVLAKYNFLLLRKRKPNGVVPSVETDKPLNTLAT
jgi:hypothetical protein